MFVSCYHSLPLTPSPHSFPLSRFYGNVVDLWEGLAAHTEKTGENLVELASDQTSLHNPYNGGYYPVQLSYEESNLVMNQDPDRFKSLVQESLRRQVKAINFLCSRGMNFWDYGNAFLLEVSLHGRKICTESLKKGKILQIMYKVTKYIKSNIKMSVLTESMFS